MSLEECASVDKYLTKAYQYHLNFMPHDAKHSIFISDKLGGLGLRLQENMLAHYSVTLKCTYPTITVYLLMH